MRCDECKWWTPIGEYDRQDNWTQWKDERGVGKGDCTKNPPVIYDSEGQSNWPIVLEDDSCGSFEARMSPLENVKRCLRQQRNISLNRNYEIQFFKKVIRDTGEKFGISRKKRPRRILALMLKKYKEKITKENGE